MNKKSKKDYKTKEVLLTELRKKAIRRLKRLGHKQGHWKHPDPNGSRLWVCDKCGKAAVVNPKRFEVDKKGVGGSALSNRCTISTNK
jgi:hypothetical protein